MMVENRLQLAVMALFLVCKHLRLPVNYCRVSILLYSRSCLMLLIRYSLHLNFRFLAYFSLLNPIIWAIFLSGDLFKMQLQYFLTIFSEVCKMLLIKPVAIV